MGERAQEKRKEPKTQPWRTPLVLRIVAAPPGQRRKREEGVWYRRRYKGRRVGKWVCTTSKVADRAIVLNALEMSKRAKPE
jgi:hypothetical protein